MDYSLQQKRQSTPPMLKPSNPGVSGICSANTSFTSGPESLEAFVTMSQSKGIDSFINLAEPEFSDALMNESSPSVLYSSLMSVTIKDDSPVTRPTPAANHTGIEDSQILTDSMMQTSMFGDVADVHFNDTFTETNSAEVTMLENAGYCSSNEKTFVATPETIENEPMNGTYNTVAFKTALQSDVLAIDPHASYIVSPGHRSSAQKVPSDASYVVDRESVNSASFIVRSATPSDASFVIRKTAPDIPEENCCGSDVLYSEHNDTFNVLACDATFDKIVSTSSRKVPVNSTFKAPESANNTASIANDGVNATFQARSPAKMDTTYQYTINSKFKALESINDKLPLANDGVNATFQARSPAKMDTTYRHTVNYGNEAPVTNRYNTYRKSSTPERARNENYATNNLTVTMNDAVRVSSLENLDSTFCKPSLRIPRKLSAPLPLSRLPQSFQKSNPNLISNSLKSVKNVGRSAIPSFGYNKSARPSTARVEGGLTSKLYAMGKVKSDQRLEVKRNTAEFGMTGSGGSTDSIDSTQSAHSAPDFDDRLSSDGSNASYGTRMNIGGLQKINQLRENCKYNISTCVADQRIRLFEISLCVGLMQESTPRIMRPKRIGVLENTWVDATENLPSPILKNGSAEEFGSRSSSPHSIDSTIKTSSPLLSPVSSIQNINLASSNKDNNGEAKNSEIPINENVSTNKISEVRKLNFVLCLALLEYFKSWKCLNLFFKIFEKIQFFYMFLLA